MLEKNFIKSGSTFKVRETQDTEYWMRYFFPGVERCGFSRTCQQHLCKHFSIPSSTLSFYSSCLSYMVSSFLGESRRQRMWCNERLQFIHHHQTAQSFIYTRDQCTYIYHWFHCHYERSGGSVVGTCNLGREICKCSIVHLILRLTNVSWQLFSNNKLDLMILFNSNNEFMFTNTISFFLYKT